jgi:hypothetical protein
MPYFTCELTTLNKINFAVADDPFYKSSRSKYYPECIVISSKGKVLARINPENRESSKFPNAIAYSDDIREPQLKINDDKKITFTLNKLSKYGRMILLTVRSTDMRMKPPKEGEFDRAWYRLNNEDTNQTLDYTKLKSIEKPEGFEEDPPIEEGLDINEVPRNELIYIAGRIFFDTNGRWVYESYNQCMTTEKFGDDPSSQLLAELYQRSENEVKY